MARVMTFSRTFPVYHPRAGQQTYFVEKIWNSIGFENAIESKFNEVYSLTGYTEDFIQSFFNTLGNDINKKHHTIRAGHRWKVGDWFSPRVWSGKPYNSKQIIIAPDIQVKKVWNLYQDEYKWEFPGTATLETLAENDGLSTVDFLDWFQQCPGKVFDGQIICWNESIEY